RRAAPAVPRLVPAHGRRAGWRHPGREPVGMSVVHHGGWTGGRPWRRRPALALLLLAGGPGVGAVGRGAPLRSTRSGRRGLHRGELGITRARGVRLAAPQRRVPDRVDAAGGAVSRCPREVAPGGADRNVCPTSGLAGVCLPPPRRPPPPPAPPPPSPPPPRAFSF